MTGVGNLHLAHLSKIHRIPSIILTDTEHASLQNKLTFPFADVICTPSCYLDDLGKKQVRYEGYHELAYLHPNYFKPDPSVLDELNISKDDEFFILRFVSWEASHDVGKKGLSVEDKKKIVDELGKHGRVYITSESKLPKHFDKHRISVPPHKIHDLLYFAKMFVGEGATMASEAAVLGTPSIYINPIQLGYITEQEEKYGLVHHLVDANQVLSKIRELIGKNNLKNDWKARRDKMLSDKIDVTAWMISFIENYQE